MQDAPLRAMQWLWAVELQIFDYWLAGAVRGT